MEDYIIHVGGNMYSYLKALILGDDEKISEAEAAINKQIKDAKTREYAYLKEKLSSDDFDIFCRIDSAYKRHNAYCNWGSIGWEVADIKLPYKDYGDFELTIQFKNNNSYDLFIYYSDESGYEQGKHYLKRDIQPSDIEAEIKEMVSKK